MLNVASRHTIIIYRIIRFPKRIYAVGNKLYQQLKLSKAFDCLDDGRTYITLPRYPF